MWEARCKTTSQTQNKVIDENVEYSVYNPHNIKEMSQRLYISLAELLVHSTYLNSKSFDICWRCHYSTTFITRFVPLRCSRHAPCLITSWYRKSIRACAPLLCHLKFLPLTFTFPNNSCPCVNKLISPSYTHLATLLPTLHMIYVCVYLMYVFLYVCMHFYMHACMYININTHKCIQ